MPDSPHCDIAIVGAGAAGLFAVVFSGESIPPASQAFAFDGAKKLGAKILIAGGGRCNVTHDIVRPEDYAGNATRGATRNAIKKVLRSFTVDQTIEFFRGRGVELKREDTGKLFPTTDRARTVLNALLEACCDANARLLTEHRVTAIERRPDDGGFVISTSRGAYTASRVVLSTGGLALPKTGSDGFGYRLAESLGHTVTETWPALVPLVLPANHWLTELKGIAVDVELSLAGPTGKVFHKQDGAMLLTHFGLSGPAAMDISRHFGGDFTDRAHTLTANLLPPHTFDTLEAELLEQTTAHPRRTVLQVVQPHFPERLAAALAEHGARLEPGLPLARLPKDGRRALVRTLTALPLPVTADRGYEFAEVTAGGVPLSEVNLSTMESRVCPGLHLAGEILDVDGRIGGYNFQWAWCTGRLAGIGAAKSLAENDSTAKTRRLK
ncbi:MAG: aminoacetone oxidase family FAD-binding enzyme [Planctomycetota bacterium]